GRADGRRRQLDGEGRAPTVAVAVDANRAAVQLDDVTDDRQTEPESAVGPGGRALRLPEPVEDVRQEGGLDPLTGVAHGDLDVRVDALEAELDAPVPRGELDGVREQVPPSTAPASRRTPSACT